MPIDTVNDYLIIYDSSAATHMKVTPYNAFYNSIVAGAGVTVTKNDVTGVMTVAAVGGATLPADAVGSLVNDGAGGLSWVPFSTSPDGSLLVPVGTTAQRDAAPTDGMFRYNTDIPGFEGYVNGVWTTISGGVAVPSATTTVEGISERATDAEALAGTDTVRHITPFHLATSIAAILPPNAPGVLTNDGLGGLSWVGPGGSQAFTYIGADEAWVVPAGVVSIDVDVRGAGGGSWGANGGQGAKSVATISVTPGETLVFMVGGAGYTSAISAALAGPYGGGGGQGLPVADVGTGTGGGMSGIFRGVPAQGTALLIAGGGGAAGGGTNAGGDGGGLVGQDGVIGNRPNAGSGFGGTQAAGGAGGIGGAGSIAGNAGGVMVGGTSSDSTGESAGGGGGGGYFGGGSGTSDGANFLSEGGGGGGSSFSDGLNTAVTLSQGLGSATDLAGSIAVTW